MSIGALQAAYGTAMQEALALAEHAATLGEVPIGAVVIDPDGQVIGRGANARETTHDPLAHAEVVAMQDAARNRGRWRLDDCTLVVTLEPCAMCAGAIVQARIATVVFGAFDEKAGAVGSLWDLVRDPRLPHRPQVVSGISADECAGLLTRFFEAQRN
ncbi:MAG: tRNA-specific adenosine deaminase [Actinomycetota bacterium]